ncbi:MAG: glycosyltransferase [Caulobacteraceae bacterium]|nr:glycosyltransferase [Caulobacteraceae bacterium]
MRGAEHLSRIEAALFADGAGAPLRVAHVVAGLDPSDGGPSYSVPRLCRGLSASAGAAVELYSVAGAGEGRSRRQAEGYADRRCGWDHARTPLLGALRFSSELASAIGSAAVRADVIHSHGLWLWPNIAAGRAAAFRGTAHVISPRGMLSAAALSFSALKKRAVWTLVQGQLVRRAALLHATSEAECAEFRALGLAGPVAVIPNGVDLPEPARGSGPPPRVALALGRIHPKKNLAALLRAWARVEAERPEWRLRIVGPAEDGHDLELAELARKLGLTRVSIEGPAFGAAKLEALRGAALLVLPTLNENFGLVVAEALSAGVPVICTKGAPWAGLETEGCGWWIDHGETPLADALLGATAAPALALSAMGARGRAWMGREFDWRTLAGRMAEVYRWLRFGGAPPPTVITE